MPGSGAKRAKKKSPIDDLFYRAKLTTIRVGMAVLEILQFMLLVWVHSWADGLLDRWLLPEYPICVKFVKLVFGICFSVAYIGIGLSFIETFLPGIFDVFRGRDK